MSKTKPKNKSVKKQKPSDPVILFLEAWKSGRKKEAYRIVTAPWQRKYEPYNKFLEMATRDLDSFDTYKIKKIRKHPRFSKYMGYDVIVSLFSKGKLFNNVLFQVAQDKPGKYNVEIFVSESSQ